MLLPADSRGRYAAPVGFGRVGREATPASADFEHVVQRSQLEFAADAVELANLCLFQSVFRAFVVSAGVGHASVQEKVVKVVAKVVVIRDIAPAAGLRVPVAAVLNKVSHSP